jgi:solute carrier family 13 (sodium-dependent dicarboxylate transporter), member 2/3/5
MADDSPEPEEPEPAEHAEPGTPGGARSPDDRPADVPLEGDVKEAARVSRRAWVGRFLGPVLALAVYVLLPGEPKLAVAARGTAAVGTLMAVWWISEALPLPATALLPVALFPLACVMPVAEATAPYASDIVFLFMGGFMIALAMQRWGLHRRIALVTVLAVGTRPNRVVAGFMLATAFLSMWVSNTATTVMMLPIGLSVLQLVFDRVEGVDADEITGAGAPNFATCLMLAIAYAASIGSLATLIGTPPNIFMAGFLEQTYGILILHRRLVRDYEHRTASSASRVYWAISHVMVRRLTGANTSTWRVEAVSA